MMKLVKNIVVMISLITVVMYAKQMKRLPAQGVPVTSTPPAAQPKGWVAPDISTLPAPLNQTPEGYAQNKVAAVSQQLINEIFPHADTIERVVFAFRDEYPGSFKETDVKILYDAIINNPEIKKHLTLKNATPIYNFIKDALSKAWDKKGE
jgi:hypothetical protein